MATAVLPANDLGDPLANVALECSLLGLLLTDNSHLDRAADVMTADDFSDPGTRHVYETILHHVSQGKAANRKARHK